LLRLQEWVFGHNVIGTNSKGPLVDEGPVPASTAPNGDARFPTVAERVKSIREDLEQAIKTGKLQTKEDATDFVAKRVIASNGQIPRVAEGPAPAPDHRPITPTPPDMALKQSKGDGGTKDGRATQEPGEVAGISHDIFVPPSKADIDVVNGVYDLSATARLLYNESAKDRMTVHTTRPKGVETVTKTPGSLATIAGPMILTESISDADRGDLIRATAVFHESFHKLQQKYLSDPNSVPEAVRLLIESVSYPGEVIEAADMEARRVQNIIIQEISSKTGKNHVLLKVYGNERMKPGTEMGKGFSPPENVPATTPPFPGPSKPSTEQAKPKEAQK
jgi:hypothetical protein